MTPWRQAQGEDGFGLKGVVSLLWKHGNRKRRRKLGKCVDIFMFFYKPMDIPLDSE